MSKILSCFGLKTVELDICPKSVLLDKHLLKFIGASFRLHELGSGVLTKSNTKKGGRLTDLDQTSTQRQPSNLGLWLGLLGSHFVDIGIKLHSV